MSTTVATDYRTPLLAFRAALRHAQRSPMPSTLDDLSRALLALPTGPFNMNVEDARLSLIRSLERAEEHPLFARIEHMTDAVNDLARMMPSWLPPYAAEATADVTRLLAACHDHQDDMEERPLNPWSRAAEAGTRLFGIILRRTDARPADALMVNTAEEFADRMRVAIASPAVRMAAQFAEYAARSYGMFPIGPRAAQTNGGRIEWSRRFGTTRYVFELIGPGELSHFPHGRMTVRLSGTYEPAHTFALTARTRRKIIDRFIRSL